MIGDLPFFDPLLCARSEKAALETQNTASQLAYIDHLVTVVGARELRESHVLELHKIAVEGIYPCAGHYRNAIHDVQIQASKHRIPEAALVPGLVLEAVETLNAQRQAKSAVQRAAYALWRFNWIHPFPGGNGRTSRALTYLIICMDNGAMLPGEQTMPRLIADEGRQRYLAALREADAAEKRGNRRLTQMNRLMEYVLARQLSSALKKLIATPRRPTRRRRRAARTSTPKARRSARGRAR